MKAQKTMRFSDMQLGIDTVKFERRQFEIYEGLVNRHPNNNFYMGGKTQIAESLKTHEKQLEAYSKKEPAAKKTTVNKATVAKPAAKKPAKRKKAGLGFTAKKVAAKKPAAKKVAAKKPAAKKVAAKKPPL